MNFEAQQTWHDARNGLDDELDSYLFSRTSRMKEDVLCFEYSQAHQSALLRSADEFKWKKYTPGVVRLSGNGPVVAFTSFKRLASARDYTPTLYDGQLVGCAAFNDLLFVARFNGGVITKDPRVTPELQKQAKALIDGLRHG